MSYQCTGQSLHSLAHAYNTSNYDKQIMSKCSPQVYDIFASKASMNSPLLDVYKDTGEIAFDINQQYTNILTKCDSYGWAMYMPIDEVEIYDGRIDTGRYYVETTNAFALEGNGWYCDSVVDKALEYKLITS